MFKFVERTFLLYSEFGVDNIFNIDDALKVLSKNESLSKQTVRSSLEISMNKGLISIDSKTDYSFFYLKRKKDVRDFKFVEREKLKHYDKIKTYYKFDKKNLIIMIKYFNLKPKDGDITPDIVKMFLNPENET